MADHITDITHNFFQKFHDNGDSLPVDTELTATIDPAGLATQATLSALNTKVTACNTGAVAGSVTANAGTNLNTSLLALETGGNLATIAGDTTSIDGKITACNTGAIAGSVTANAGTNLNTSALALETGGNLAAAAARLLSAGTVAAADLLASILATAGATSGAAVVTDAAGTLQQYLRGLVTLVAARIPAIGPQTAAASLSVTPATTIPAARATAAVVSAASAGDNALVAADGTKVVRCYRLVLVFGGATTAIIKQGSTALTGTMTFQQGGSLVLDFDEEPWFVGAAGAALNLTLGSAVQVSGTIWYTQA
jgi:hypothetical protein